MYKHTQTYTDFNGVTQTEDFYFNLTSSELIDLESSDDGSYSEKLKAIVAAPSGVDIAKTITDLLSRAYGEKSEDGKKFRKSDVIRQDFLDSAAYDAILLSLLTNDLKAAAFLEGVMPRDLMEQAKAEALKQQTAERIGTTPAPSLPPPAAPL